MTAQLTLAREAALRAGEIILSLAGTTDVSEKASNNLVTRADTEAERAIVAAVSRAFPGDTIISEEGFPANAVAADAVWIIDPLDGTNNFVHGIPHYCVSIAYAEKARVLAGVVYDPVRRELFHAAPGQGAFCNDAPIRASSRAALSQAMVAMGFHYDRGPIVKKTLDAIGRLFAANVRDVRRTGSAALDFCWVARGRFDAYFEYRLSVWDIAAGMLIAREAGASCLDRTGSELTLDSAGVIVSNRGLRDPFLDAVRWPD